MKTADEIAAIVFNERYDFGKYTDEIKEILKESLYEKTKQIVTRTLELVAADAGFWGRATARAMAEVKNAKANDRLALWAHLVSMHAGIYSLDLTFEQLDEIHENEHKGPGTIRNHPPYARHADLVKLGKVLSEGEPHCGEVIIDSQGIFRVCRLEPGHEGKHHG